MDDNNNYFYQKEQKPKNGGVVWLWIILIIIILGVGGYFGYQKLVMESGSIKVSELNSNTNAETGATKEDWVINPQIFNKDTTSTDTVKASDNLYRIFYMQSGEIYYSESADLASFGVGKATGVREERGKMISNPAVLQVTAEDWVMIYEMAPTRQPGAQNGPPSTANQRDLYLAKSQDGKSFVPVGNVINSAKADNYFASVPDLVKTPDGKIRMYYVSGGQAIGSVLSSDNGVTWVKETGYRLEDQAVDPNVIVKTENGQTSWVMYYSVLDPTKNAIYKATSEDGLVWENGTKLFTATTGGAAIDPDVTEITPQKFVMLFGQSTAGGSTGGEEINLYRAELNQSIFD